MRFQATAGQTYRIETLNLASGTDTVLELYAPDGTTLIDRNDDSNGLASLITFTPGAGGSYYVKAVDFSNSAAGVAISYDLRIRRFGVPGSPTGVSAVGGNALATVSWTPPGSDGGNPITGYTVTSSPGGLAVAAGAAQTSAVVNGLTNETPYTFTVTATNAAGSGLPSAPSNPVTPTALKQPTIKSFTPSSGPVGTSVAISGSGFTGATAVKFHGTNAQSFAVNSDTRITAVVAGGTTSGTVSVTGPVGTGTSSGSYTVTLPAAPKVTGLSPSNGPVGTSVTISGSGFTGATAVKFHGTDAQTFIVNSSTKITAVVASGTTSGTVSVTGPAGTGTSSKSFSVR